MNESLRTKALTFALLMSQVAGCMTGIEIQAHPGPKGSGPADTPSSEAGGALLGDGINADFQKETSTSEPTAVVETPPPYFDSVAAGSQKKEPVVEDPIIPQNEDVPTPEEIPDSDRVQKGENLTSFLVRVLGKEISTLDNISFIVVEEGNNGLAVVKLYVKNITGFKALGSFEGVDIIHEGDLIFYTQDPEELAALVITFRDNPDIIVDGKTEPTADGNGSIELVNLIGFSNKPITRRTEFTANGNKIAFIVDGISYDRFEDAVNAANAQPETNQAP